jgi:hypothetical protein
MKKIDNLDSLLSSDNLNSSVIELDNFICELCEWGDNVDALTEAQRNFYYNQNLEREINNGGFNQYFINSSGDFVHETINSLRTIGAHHTADILQAAIDSFLTRRCRVTEMREQNSLNKLGKLQMRNGKSLTKNSLSTRTT